MRRHLIRAGLPLSAPTGSRSVPRGGVCIQAGAWTPAARADRGAPAALCPIANKAAGARAPRLARKEPARRAKKSIAFHSGVLVFSIRLLRSGIVFPHG